MHGKVGKMYVRYSASIGPPQDGRWHMAENSKECFNGFEKAESYAKEVFFYPIGTPAPTYMCVIGYEKAHRDKAIVNRTWDTMWGLHVCVGGKGHYNNVPIQRGTCFVAWPYVPHSIITDKDEPLEFYWLMLRGNDLSYFVKKYGFNEDCLVFDIKCVDDIAQMFELGFSVDYDNFSVRGYTDGFLKMLLSFVKPTFSHDEEKQYISEHGSEYTKMVMYLLRSSNYTVTVEEMSTKMGISSKYLSKVFLKDTGETLKHYIVRKKFEFAVKLLERGVSPVSVADILKYSDYAAFYKMFVAKCGVPPTEFIKKS